MAGHLKELRITMADRPGAIAKLAETLGKAGVNIESLSAQTAGGNGDIRILVADPAAARTALEAAGITCGGEREMAFVELEDRPGTLAAAARKLADAGVNIDAIYMAGKSGGKVQVAIGSSDAAKARAALK